VQRDIDALVAELTLDEKASLTAGADLWSTAAVARVGIPAVRMTDGPNGARGPRLPAAFGGGEDSPSVCTPCGTALAASWDPALVAEVGALLGDEARARGCRILLAPTVNLQRSPLAGRNFECYSEDPLLSGAMAAAFVRGVQSRGVVATVKHLAGNESEHERMTMDSVIDERTLRELYLLPFELAVREGGALGVMTAYNRLNGSYGPDNQDLLSGILRGEWGFEGFVVTDWFGFADTVAAARAGLDLEMPGPGRSFGAALATAVRSGAVPEATVDAAVARLLRVFDRIGALDDDVREPTGGVEAAATPTRAAGGVEAAATPTGERAAAATRTTAAAGAALARRAAVAGAVLLRNDGLLPLAPGGIRRLAVIGPLADRAEIMGGGSAQVTPPYRRSPLDALTDRLDPGTVIDHEPGLAWPEATDAAPGHRAPPATPAAPDGEALAPAVAAASAADAVVVVVGTGAAWESEGFDRATMHLPAGQDDLVTAVVVANPRTVVVVNAGAPVGMDWAEHAAAVVQIWFGGQEMAEALVDVLLGVAEPSGRLPHTIPMRVEHNPSYGRFPAENGRLLYGEGLLVGHRWYEARHLPVRYPFGHGLSYTTFEIGPPSPAITSIERGGDVQVTVPITNTGTRTGSEVVQCYVEAVDPRLARPPRELKAFAKVTLHPGETRNVRLHLAARAFACWDPGDPDAAPLGDRLRSSVPWAPPLERHPDAPGWVIDAGRYRLHIGRSSADLAHVCEVTLT